jgi:hypothetical protein
LQHLVWRLFFVAEFVVGQPHDHAGHFVQTVVVEVFDLGAGVPEHDANQQQPCKHEYAQHGQREAAAD